jgi:hypothetical protein
MIYKGVNPAYASAVEARRSSFKGPSKMTESTLVGEDPGKLAVPLTGSVDGLSAVLMRLRVATAHDALDTALAHGADPPVGPS